MRSEIADLKKQIRMADAVIVGAGSGFSTAAGFTYGGQRLDVYKRQHPAQLLGEGAAVQV